MIPVIGHIMHRKAGGPRRRRRGLALGVGEGEAVGARGRQRLVATGGAGKRGATRALEGDLPVCRVGVRARLQHLERRAAVDAGCRVATFWFNGNVFLAKIFPFRNLLFELRIFTHVAHRAVATALLPFAHPTVRGLVTMVPPQAIPVQPTAMGAAI